MSILGRIAPDDLEALSAYVDGFLPAREQAGLEMRLQEDAVLRQGLAELRSVKASLGGLPPRRLPRNFTLRGADIRHGSAPQGFRVLRFATAFASLLFVVTTAVRWLPTTLSLGATAPAARLAGEVQGQLDAAVAATQEPSAELRSEAPAPAAAAEGLADSLAFAATPTPAGTACPECPPAETSDTGEAGVTAEAGAMAEAGATVEAGREDESTALGAVPTTRIMPLEAAQWLFGIGAIVLGFLAVRARRP